VCAALFFHMWLFCTLCCVVCGVLLPAVSSSSSTHTKYFKLNFKNQNSKNKKI
jgi:hypothetical protein